MNCEKDLKQILKNKHVLLDTNVLIDASANMEAFASMFALLESVNAKPIYFTVIELEFLSGIHQVELIEVRKALIYKFEKMPMNPFDEYANCAIKITTALTSRRYKTGNMDALIMSVILKFRENIVLITRNHEDFPTILLDRPATFSIDKGNSDVLALGVYAYSQEKTNKLKL